MDYVKLDITIKERLLFLFTGLIKKEYVINNVIETKVTNTPTPEKVLITKSDEPDFEVSIPFFEFDNEKTKSNL
jgi:hypothetical protein